MKRNYITILLSLFLLALMVSCEKEEAARILQNDCIKRTLGPNVVGLPIEFAYAIALPQDAGTITNARVEASIAGAAGTYLEHRSFYTSGSGSHVGVIVGNPSVTTGTETEVTFTADTCAATLRYYYIIPEDARGQEVTFVFSAQASNGETVSYTMGPYKIAAMDMRLDLTLNDASTRYLSIADMAVYDEVAAAAIPDKIDLVYLYRNITGISFNHALVAPASDSEFRPGITLPTGVDNNTRFIKMWALRDQHLARLQYGIFIDDLDFQELDFSGASNYGINMRAEAGAWIETEDGNYRAFVYVNTINNSAGTMRVSIKRYTMN